MLLEEPGQPEPQELLAPPDQQEQRVWELPVPRVEPVQRVSREELVQVEPQESLVQPAQPAPQVLPVLLDQQEQRVQRAPRE